MRLSAPDFLVRSTSQPCINSAAARAFPGPRTAVRRSAVERDLDWEPEVKRKGTLVAPGSGKRGGMPPPPPPPPAQRRKVDWFEVPFSSRRNIALTMLGGSAALWLYNHRFPLDFLSKPDIDFNLAGFTDIPPEQFVYFKTPGGNWVASAQDEEGRLFMIDQIGDLYYDTGDPEIGFYVMDTQGNLYNEYADLDGERKIKAVGNVRELSRFKINEIAGVKLDRDVNIVAFKDGSNVSLQAPTPDMIGPDGKIAGVELDREVNIVAFKDGSNVSLQAPTPDIIGPDGKLIIPGELMEGYVDSEGRGAFLGSAFGGAMSNFASGISGLTSGSDSTDLNIDDPTSFSRQIFDQTLLGDPSIGIFSPPLPEDFDIDKLIQEVVEESKAAGIDGGFE
eukprot:gene18864-25419_t